MKTIEEKATAYALENAHMGAAVSTIARAYIAGAFEALAGQRRSGGKAINNRKRHPKKKIK